MAVLLDLLGLAEHLPACLEHGVDLGALHSTLPCAILCSSGGYHEAVVVVVLVWSVEALVRVA